VHLCFVPVCTICVCVICRCRWGTRGTCYVCCRSCLECEKSCLVWERNCSSISIAKERRHLQSSNLSESSISECVRLCDVHMAYTYGPGQVTCMYWHFMWHFLSVTHRRCTYVLCENRSLIQCLALMHLAIMFWKCSADYYGRPSAIFRVKRSHVRSFLVLVWQNVRTIPAWSDEANTSITRIMNKLLPTCAYARAFSSATTPILPRGRRIQHETWLWGNREQRLGSKQETKASPSNPDYIKKKWQVQLEREHQTMT